MTRPASTTTELVAGPLLPTGAVSRRPSSLSRLRRHRLAAVGGLGLLLLALMALIAPLLTPHQFDQMDLDSMRQPPTWRHPFGTDDLGRDLFTRVIYGARISLGTGLCSAAIATLVGTTIGAVAGYFGGWTDNLSMRLVDLMLSIPLLPIVIVISAVMKPTVPVLVLVIGLFGWMVTARLVRSSFLVLKAQDFTLAAQVIGAPPGRIIVCHLLPNAVAPIVVAATLSVGSAIILESILSFLGMGVQPPTPSWGNMLQDAQSTMATKPWMAIFPGLFIFISVMCVNFLGDGLRDALDPRLRV
ncbi:MAG TPA: ABC transporter permease [Chloroflexota bacterium]|nr:ABC transporter permease [Chloroflexota bacterium]